MNEETYIGLLEHNESEGETFGYYFPYSEETSLILRNFVDSYSAYLQETEGWDGDMLDVDGPFTLDQISMIEYGANNGYMGRCHLVPGPDIVIEALPNFVWGRDDVYKGQLTINGDEYSLR